jgi:hypothetical protein
MTLLGTMGIIIVTSLIFTFFTLYHLIRFGVGVKPKITAAIFLTGSIVLLLAVSVISLLVNTKVVADEIKTYVNFYLLQK